jgi:hypothetical protein
MLMREKKKKKNPNYKVYIVTKMGEQQSLDITREGNRHECLLGLKALALNYQ